MNHLSLRNCRIPLFFQDGDLDLRAHWGTDSHRVNPCTRSRQVSQDAYPIEAARCPYDLESDLEALEAPLHGCPQQARVGGTNEAHRCQGPALGFLVLVRQEVLEPPALGVLREAERDADTRHVVPCRFLRTHDLGFQRDLLLTYLQEKLKLSARG